MASSCKRSSLGRELLHFHNILVSFSCMSNFLSRKRVINYCQLLLQFIYQHVTVISLQQFIKMWYFMEFYQCLDHCTKWLSEERFCIITLLPIHHQLAIKGYRNKANNENYCPHAGPLSTVLSAVIESLACLV